MGYSAGNSPLLIMGGGYDTCEDSDPNTCSSTKGNKVYVMDADTGALLKTLDTDRGVVGDVFVVSDRSTGLAKHAYAADLGGNIYRINIGSADPAIWTMVKLASLGCDTTSTCSANRKFMFTPDVLYDNGKYVLLIGSGDREKPINGYTSAISVANHFFMLRDDPTDSSWLSSEFINCGSAVICKNSLYGIAAGATSPTPATVEAKKGWYLGMEATEQVVTSAITIFGKVSFSSHKPAVPTPGSCDSNLGTACVYNIAYANAASLNGTDNRCEEVQGGGLPPSPVAGMVTLDSTTDPVTGEVTLGQTVPFSTGTDPRGPVETKLETDTTAAVQPKSRVYWNIQQ
jgi:type IV pilus assembly protein PilY1